MKNIAILTGGDSEERVISLKSAQVVAPGSRGRNLIL